MAIENEMTTLLLCLGVATSGLVLHLLSRKLTKGHGGRWLWPLLIVFTIATGTTPLILIKEGVLVNSVANIVIAACAAVYFALVMGRTATNMRSEAN